MFIPDFNYSLLSVSKLATDYGLEFIFHKHGCVLQDQMTKKHLADGFLEKNLYFFSNCNSNVACNVVTQSKSLTDSIVWHSRLGHPSSVAFLIFLL